MKILLKHGAPLLLICFPEMIMGTAVVHHAFSNIDNYIL